MKYLICDPPIPVAHSFTASCPVRSFFLVGYLSDISSHNSANCGEHFWRAGFVRIAQVWEDKKKRLYRLNSACCWIRSTIADPGAGPSVIGQRLLHALPPDAVVRHVRTFDETATTQDPAVVTTALPLPAPDPSPPFVHPAPAAATSPAPAAPSVPTVPAGSVSSNYYRDSDYRLHSSKVAFFDPLTGEVYSHTRKAGGLDLLGGPRDQGETSAAAALLRECLAEELRVPASLASRLRKYAKRAPYVQVVPHRTAVHVVSLWLVSATPAESWLESSRQMRASAKRIPLSCAPSLLSKQRLPTPRPSPLVCATCTSAAI